MAPKKTGTMKCPHCDGTGHLPIDDAHVGTMILAHRKGKKMTQQNLCAAVGLSRAQIANIEAGRSDVPLKTLARFAVALKTTMRELIPG